MNKLLIGAAFATFAFAGAANATITITPATGIDTPFDNNDLGSTSGATTENGLTTWSISGSGPSVLVDTSVDSHYKQPGADPNHYVYATSEGGGNDVTIWYTHPVYSFDILWGTPDSYNLITLGNGEQISGDSIPGAGWYLIQDSNPFTSWTASSSGVAFEFDLNNVPEPSTWAMMGLGFAALGFAAFRRSNKDRAAIA
jgi:hypothetical protein